MKKKMENIKKINKKLAELSENDDIETQVIWTNETIADYEIFKYDNYLDENEEIVKDITLKEERIDSKTGNTYVTLLIPKSMYSSTIDDIEKTYNGVIS